jgi:hypothetical protein
MTVYFAMLTFICFLALSSLFLPKRMGLVRHGISLVGYGSMCIFIGLRDHIGGDWNAYREIFQAISELPILQVFFVTEPLYALCNRLVYAVGGDIHIVNLICATIMLAGLFKFSRLAEIDANLLLFIAAPYLLFVVGMGYTRQSVALGLSLAAVGYLRRQRVRPFYFLTTLAALFHYSAIFLILLWWINSKKRMLIAFGMLIVASPLIFFFALRERYYTMYLSGSTQTESHGVWARLFIVMVGIAVVFVQRSRWIREDGLRRAIIRGGVALSFLILVSFFLSTMADRLCLYLMFIYLLAFGYMIRYAHPPFRYLSLLLILSFSYSIFLVWFQFSSFATAAWYPYAMAVSGAN